MASIENVECFHRSAYYVIDLCHSIYCPMQFAELNKKKTTRMTAVHAAVESYHWNPFATFATKFCSDCGKNIIILTWFRSGFGWDYLYLNDQRSELKIGTWCPVYLIIHLADERQWPRQIVIDCAHMRPVMMLPRIHHVHTIKTKSNHFPQRRIFHKNRSIVYSLLSIMTDRNLLFRSTEMRSNERALSALSQHLVVLITAIRPKCARWHD